MIGTIVTGLMLGYVFRRMFGGLVDKSLLPLLVVIIGFALFIGRVT